ncbi:MAG: TonB-dependent receptor, partial [Myxococcota bacterium]
PEEIIDAQFDGGEVNVYGAEASVRGNYFLSDDLTLNGGLAYTFTDSEFRSTFDSADPLFGNVNPGERLPYIPTHQASANFALGGARWSVNTAVSYVGSMQETADEQQPIFGDLSTDEQFIVDAGARVSVVPGGEVYARIDNLFNQQNIVSRRPFGPRPGRPFTAFMGFRYRWGAL